MTEESINVVLVNRALPYNCVGKLTGRSGVEYGHSVYEEAHGAHVCRMSLAEWRACKQDVTYGATRRWAQWEVDVEMAVGVGLAPEHLPPLVPGTAASCSPERHLPPLVPGTAASEGEGEIFTAESLAGIANFRKLVSVAKRVGVIGTERFDSSATLREAILAAQEGGAAK
jgi:hypothetical protein